MSDTHKGQPLDLRRLEHALVLARCASYARASEVLHLTQSALTRSILALESHYGVRLFDRGRTGVRPTQTGRLVLERAEHVVQAARSLDNDLRRLREQGLGRVAFGLGPAISATVLSALLIELATHHPGIDLSVQTAAAEPLLEQLRQERIDFAVFASMQLPEDSACSRREIGSLPVAFVVRHSHPLAFRKSVETADLEGYPLVTGNTNRSKLLGRLSITSDDFSALREVTLHTDAVWLTSPTSIASDVANGALVCLDLLEPLVPIKQSVVTRQGQHMSPAARLVLARIEELIARLGTRL